MFFYDSYFPANIIGTSASFGTKSQNLGKLVEAAVDGQIQVRQNSAGKAVYADGSAQDGQYLNSKA